MTSIELFERLIETLPTRLRAISAEKAAAKPGPSHWSPKEELGHLLDSAANNHQRIVRARFEDKLTLPGYDQNRWVELHAYQHRSWPELIEVWRALNLQLLAAAHSVPEGAWVHTCTVGDGEPATLQFIFEDYLRHMKHHLTHLGVRVDDLQ